MPTRQDLKNAIDDLADKGTKLLSDLQTPKADIAELALRYESWYTRARSTIAQVIPERLPEFVEAYRQEKRRHIDASTYTISDFLMGISLSRAGEPLFNTTAAAATKMLRQVAMVIAVSDALDSALTNLTEHLRAELLDADLAGAQELLDRGHLRAAGVVVGVALESHLKGLCDRRAIKPSKKDPSLNDYNEILKAAKAYDVPTWRLIQRLGDIRNLCAHSKERSPTAAEVEDLLSGASKILHECY